MLDICDGIRRVKGFGGGGFRFVSHDDLGKITEREAAQPWLRMREKESVMSLGSDTM